MEKQEVRRGLTIYLPMELHTWVRLEAERRQVSRSRLLYGAIECYRVFAGMRAPLEIVEEIVNGLPVTNRRRPTKMALYLASKRSGMGGEKSVIVKSRS